MLSDAGLRLAVGVPVPAAVTVSGLAGNVDVCVVVVEEKEVGCRLRCLFTRCTRIERNLARFLQVYKCIAFSSRQHENSSGEIHVCANRMSKQTNRQMHIDKQIDGQTEAKR